MMSYCKLLMPIYIGGLELTSELQLKFTGDVEMMHNYILIKLSE